MTILNILVAFAVLFVIGIIWFLLYYFNNPVLQNPDGVARVVGNCGDTMEIGLRFQAGRVNGVHHWTNGCSFSKNCVQAAANLALGNSLKDLRKISIITIMDHVGRLPDTHLHCAQLAETTLQKCVDNYLASMAEKKREAQQSTPC